MTLTWFFETATTLPGFGGFSLRLKLGVSLDRTLSDLQTGQAEMLPPGPLENSPEQDHGETELRRKV